ncbi:uncharacterized protein LOC142140033 [Mixophyes fleayi]|uniref:uncharacterized protein LOC142140033 n=1 Tax=Mixophyes fleayi TaxID=3061075 RepID=UPI003F4D934C
MSEKDLIDATVEEIASKTKYSDNYKPPDVEDDQDESVILLPRYLKEYTQNRLCVFAENALKAIVMEINREYMIDFRDEACSHDDHCIIPIDFKSTGVLEKNKRWGDGLQQFLQMKHQLSISPLSNVTNFLSNFHFFQKYACGSGLYGVSGTLGDEADVDFLKKHYKASCYVIPTHRYTKKVELMALQVEGRDLWITEICKCVKSRICPNQWVNGQAALVICEDVKTAEELQSKLVDLGAVSSSNNITLYTRSDKHNVEMRGNFDSGEVILATNLGGRGTDFKVTDQVNHSGGLSVILTHFPANRRVEKQILGRTSRKGNPGMVQMILHKQDLSPSYQGQPIEIMRCLRENYEKQRIADMENDELLEVNMRHELFTLFCKHLAEFEKHYSPTEKEDIYCIGNVKDWFSTRTKSNKLDYQPALNALKETWALWLTLHEEDINSHKDLKLLEDELRDVLKKRSENILQGKSENFYDFIKVAMDRTFLHIHEKKNDYGALDYWMKAESTDSVYRAISLYNRAFITINQSKGDYKQEAMSLLKESKQAMNVYVSEVCNTQTFGNMIRKTNFKPHNNETNFTLQMQTRMSLLQSWVNYIDRSLEKLKDLQDRNKDVITKEVSVLSLSDNNNKVVTDEMSMLYDYGISFVFEVEQKPVFCIAALLCCILGALQVLGGILICGLTCGAASQFGMGLISEGVSDMISGVKGMITGTFDWAQWAISKAITIGLSLVTAGFNLVKKAAKAIYSVAKDLLNGTRSFTSVAHDVIKSGRMVLSSATTSLTSLTSSANKDAVIQSIKGLATNATAKESMIKTAKYAGKELVKQGALEAITYGIDKAAEAAIKAIIEKLIKEEINSCVNENKDLERTLIKFIVTTAVPKSTLEAENPGNYEILLSNKEHLKQITGKACSLAVTEVLSLHETLQNVISILENSSKFLLKILKESKLSGALVKGFQLSVSIAECATQLTDIIKHVPTRSLINDQVIPIIISNIPDSSCYTEDSRSRFPDVIRMRQELQKMISEHASNEINDFLTNQLINLTKKAWENPLIKQCTQKLKEKARQWLEKITMKTFSISCTHSQNTREIQKRSDLTLLVQPSPEEIDTYVRSMQEGNGPATGLELTALTKNNLLRGRGLLITLVQKDGKKLSTDHYPGTDPTARNIRIQMQESSQASTDHSNVFEGKNALYHALAQATEQKDMSDVEQRMKNLRKEVYEEIQQNFDQYLPLMQRDLLRQSLRDMSSKYTICRDDSQMESEGKTSNIA